MSHAAVILVCTNASLLERGGGVFDQITKK